MPLFSSSEDESDILEDQNKISSDGTIWKKIKDSASPGKPPIYNIFKDIAEPLRYVKRNIMKNIM